MWVQTYKIFSVEQVVGLCQKNKIFVRSLENRKKLERKN